MTKPQPQPISLGQYVAQLGEEKFAKKYRVSRRAAQSYRFGDRLPGRETAQRIVEDPSSPMTWETIYSVKHPRPGKPGRPRKRGAKR